MALLVMLAAVIASQAQSLTGKHWFADMSDKENEIGLTMTFDTNGGCAANVALKHVEEIDGGVDLVIHFVMKVPGTYTLKGKQVSMKFDQKKAKYDLVADFKGVDEATKQMLKGMVQPELDKIKPQLTDELIESLPTNDSYEITKLTDKELQFDGGFDLVAVSGD